MIKRDTKESKRKKRKRDREGETDRYIILLYAISDGGRGYGQRARGCQKFYRPGVYVTKLFLVTDWRVE